MSERVDDKPAVAIALNYPGAGAPKVSAKGRGAVARRIVELAAENDIPLWQDAGLAGVLAQVDLDDEIPAALYAAVAEVIAFAWRLRGMDLAPSTEGTGQQP